MCRRIFEGPATLKFSDYQRCGRGHLQANFITLAGGGDDQVSAALSDFALRLLDHRRDFFVGVIGVVMEEGEPLRAGSHR